MPVELAGGKEVGPIWGEVDMVQPGAGHPRGVKDAQGARVTEGQLALRLLDDDRVATVGGEVHVVGVADGDIGPGAPAGVRVDRREAVAPLVVGGVQGA